MASKPILSDGLEPVLSQTEKSCTASNYRQFSTNIKIKAIKLIPVLLTLGTNKTCFNLIIFLFNIRGKLSINAINIY